MHNDIQIQIDPSDVEKKLRKLHNVKDGAVKSMTRALNRAVTGMKTDAKTGIAGKRDGIFELERQDVDKYLEVNRASYSNLSVRMRSTGRPMKAVKFPHEANENPGKKGSRPVSLRVKKNSAGNVLSGKNNNSSAFVATMRSGHTGIFQRTGARTSAKTVAHSVAHKNISRSVRRTFSKKGREKIQEIHSPGVAQMLDNKKLREKIQAKATERFNKELDHQIEYLLSQQKG